MKARLLIIVRERVNNGEITESHLARLVGASQSHIHNVLKGVRKLSPELADEILNQLRLTTKDLLDGDPATHALPFRPVALLSGGLGEQMRSFEPQKTAGSVHLPAQSVAIVGRPLAARLGEDSRALPRFQSGDLVLMDQSVSSRRSIASHAVYVVITSDGPRLRYVRQGSGRIYLAAEDCLAFPGKWEPVKTDVANLLFFIRARVVWVGRDLQLAMTAWNL
jgi:hypothetical protein